MKLKPILFIKNAWKFRGSLSSFKEYGANYFIESFLKDYLEVLLKYYSKKDNCWQSDESRLDIVCRIEELLEMHEPAFDEFYFLRELPEEAYDVKNWFKPSDDGNYSTFVNDQEWNWTIEEVLEAQKKKEEAKVKFFEKLQESYEYFWD
jgi:hypothetical protein